MDKDYLFIIKVKDMDSAPEVYYKGERKEVLVDVDYSFLTKGEGEKGEGRHRFSLGHYESNKDVWKETIYFERIGG